eukprot:g44995.t1
MFSFEDFYRHEHGSLAHAQPAADDFDPRLALLAPVVLARPVVKVENRLFCARAPGTPVRRTCAVLQDFELQAKVGGRLVWRAASGRGRITAQLHVPSNMKAAANGGGPPPSASACPRQVSVALPGTADMALEFSSTQIVSAAQILVRGARGWCNSTLPPALRLVWPLATNCTTPAEVRLLVGGALCFVWRAAAAIPPAAEQELLRSSYTNEQAVLLGQIANLSVASLQAQADWQRLVTQSILDYGRGWLNTRSAVGVWVADNGTAGNATAGNATAGRRALASSSGSADPFAPTVANVGAEAAAAALNSLSDWSAGQGQTVEELARQRLRLDAQVSDLQAKFTELKRNWTVFETAFRNSNGTDDEVWSFLGSLCNRANDTKCLLDAMGVGAHAVSPGQLANLSSNFEVWHSRYLSGDKGVLKHAPPLRRGHNRALAAAAGWAVAVGWAAALAKCRGVCCPVRGRSRG